VATVQQQADQKQQQALAAVQADYQKQISARDAQLVSFQSQVSSQIAGVKTISQAATVIDHYLPADQQVTVKPAPLDTLPNAPKPQPTIDFTQAQSVSLAQKLLQCDESNRDSATCKADLNDTKLELEDQKKQTDLADQDAVVWKNMAKGGTLWQRVLHKVEWGAVTTAVAVGGYEVGKHTK
jgi:hypothetical protein